MLILLNKELYNFFLVTFFITEKITIIIINNNN